MPTKRTVHQTTGGPGGGGINSRATAKLTTYHAGYPSQRINPGGVAQYGSAVGNHVAGLDGGSKSTGYRGDQVRMGAMPNRELGNECAVRTVAGPGGSRSVMPTGGQGQHGPVAGKVKPQGADILRDYGAESPTALQRMKR
jgi:hypothetical protein